VCPGQTRDDQQLKIQADTLTVQADALYEAHKELAQAVDMYKRALSIYRQLKLRENIGYVLQNLGRCYEKLGRYQEFVTTFEEVYTLLPPEEVVARTKLLLEIGGAYQLNLGSPKRALDCFQKAEALLTQPENASRRASVLTLIAMMHYVLGNPAEMKRAFIAAAEIYKAQNEHFKEADVYLQLGTLADTPRDAEFYLNQALIWWRRLKVVSDKAADKEAETLETFGSFYRAFNDRLSLSYFEQAYDLWKQLGNTKKQASVLAEIALMGGAGDSDKARRNYEAAREFYRRQNDKAGEADVVTRMGWSDIFNDRLRDGVVKLKEAATLWTNAGRALDAVAALSEAAYTQGRLGEKTDSMALLAKTLDQYEKLDLQQPAQQPIRERIAGNIALTYFFNKDYKNALTHFSQQLERMRAGHDRRDQAAALFHIGSCYELQGDIDAALRYYFESIALREQIRGDTTIDSLRRDLFTSDIGVYQRAVLNLMAQKRGAEAFELSERARARSLLDQVEKLQIKANTPGNENLLREERGLSAEISMTERERRAEAVKTVDEIDEEKIASLNQKLDALGVRYDAVLNSLKAFQPEYVSLKMVDTLKLPAVQQALKAVDPETTLLSYFVTPEKLFAFIITPNSFEARDLCPNSNDTQCVDAIKGVIDASVGFKRFAAAAEGHPKSLQTLYDRLIRPIKTDLKTTNLAIIPNGFLNYVPFAALSDGQRYLVEDFTIYQLPNASILPFLVKKRKPSNNSILALANGTAENLPPLKLVGDTARYIAELYGATAKLDKNATESFLVDHAGRAEIVFVSAHGEYDARNPLFSNMTLAPDPDKRNDGILNVHEIYDLNLQETNFVVLSGCETQLGELSSGDDIIALNRAFIYAGSPSVLASLWSVDEAPTQVLMKHFFDHLTDKKTRNSRARALRLAQLDTMTEYKNPYSWSAFALTGLP
jgi:tetratricopeptide (TPR) repeat protein